MISGLCYWNKAVNSLVLVSLCTRTAVSRIYAKENFFHIYYSLWSSHLELEIHDHCLHSTDEESETQVLSQGHFAGIRRTGLQ